MSKARLFLGALSAIALAACGSQQPALPETEAEALRTSTAAATDTTQSTTSLGQMGSGYKTDPVATTPEA